MIRDTDFLEADRRRPHMAGLEAGEKWWADFAALQDKSLEERERSICLLVQEVRKLDELERLRDAGRLLVTATTVVVLPVEAHKMSKGFPTLREAAVASLAVPEVTPK